MEQVACTGARGLSRYSAAHVPSEKLLGDLQMDDLHEKVKYSVISSSLSDELYEGHFYFINAGSGVKQEACIRVPRLAPDLATHVLSDKSLRTLHQMANLHEETKLLVISWRLSKGSERHSHL